MQNTWASEKWFILLYLFCVSLLGYFPHSGDNQEKCIVSESNHRRFQEEKKQASNTENPELNPPVALAGVTSVMYY